METRINADVAGTEQMYLKNNVIFITYTKQERYGIALSVSSSYSIKVCE